MKRQTFIAAVAALGGASALAQQQAPADTPLDEITVFGQGRPLDAASRPGPVSTLQPEDLVSINAATTEDLVKYEPNLVIRRRYVGDPNGTMGMRGSNMFQTTRSMVFADGIPLHYLLQTQFNGSPRWSLVGADEVALVEVLYGPFSAEYSGNAMGGVVNIETRIPTERSVRIEGSMFQQAFDHLGFDDAMAGSRAFLSYGDRVDDLSVYVAYSHLDNDSQPMDFLFDAVAAPAGDEIAVSGASAQTDEYGNDVLYFGNTGRQSSVTDQVKAKVGYEFGDWLALATVAYEEREIVRDRLENYLRTESGEPVWNGTVVQDGIAFEVASSDFAVDLQDRRSLLLGARIQGPLSERWWLEASLSDFGILEDESRGSNANPRDPAYTPDGSVDIYDDTGWQTASIKLRSEEAFGSPALSLVAGFDVESYSLEIENFSTVDYLSGVRSSRTGASGGKTQLQAVYAQLGWRLSARSDLSLGARHESWESSDGFYYDYLRNNLQDHEDRSESRFSPKFSIGFQPKENWQLRYSVARAYRFPIVEELYQNERRTSGTSIANADLEPEDGLHQNLMLERRFDTGNVRVNLFDDTVEDVIFNQRTIVDNRAITTFLPIDEVNTRGVEFIVNRSGIGNRLDLRFNVAWVDSEIVHNAANTDIEGKVFPRMPKWRSHLLATWYLTDRFDVGGGVRYSSNSYGDLDNADTAHGVFGAHDAYTQVSLKARFLLRENVRLSLGIDNLTDELAFVHHPWPGRTVFAEAAVSL